MGFGLEIIDMEEAPTWPTGRAGWRRLLLDRREKFVAGPAAQAAGPALGAHLVAVLGELEPESLGLYWAMRSEFNAAAAIRADRRFAETALALPCAGRSPVAMTYRAWDGAAPTHRDECGIPTATGRVVVPEVVLVPCVGFAAGGWRLGYGGGYFDRWLAAHPGVTVVGVAWACGELPAGAFAPQSHDLPLTLIVTERGVM